jgi:CubicO group peptidase (beta-lactamase class C family)
LAWLLLSLPIFAADQFEGIRDFIRSRLTTDQVPSISVAVARDGRVLWEEGFGWADREKRVAANEHTMYSLASITKPFTATALMTLVEQKRIDLDRGARLPDQAQFYPPLRSRRCKNSPHKDSDEWLWNRLV